MNIKEAKEEIIHTLLAYHHRDEMGNYTYPRVRQRPVLLMGPPGIGKTAIMEQVARECGIGLVAYTITHHTRQSAIGLPHIESRDYGGRTMSVTEYTMSEIIASVYECMERTGRQEGILFIDEINCVSETLAPVMLQFLQNKTFGTHKVPEGWMIVAAGNPPEYNKSAREFDIVTLDRVRRIDVEADCGVWMEYAWQREIHPAILSYLSIRPERFYLVENLADDCAFVTARGWEDLSELLKSYEEMDIPASEELVQQYLQKQETAREFFAYYQLHCKYGTDYAVERILTDAADEEELQEKISMARNGDFEERFTVVNLVLSYLNFRFSRHAGREERIRLLHESLQYLKSYLSGQEDMSCLREFIEQRRESLQVKVQAELISVRAGKDEEWVLKKLEEYMLSLKKEHLHGKEEGFAFLKEQFSEEVCARNLEVRELDGLLKNAFAFLERCFGEGQEMILFLSGLTHSEKIMEFIGLHGCEPYLRQSEKLLYKKQEEKLKEECRRLMSDDSF